MSPVAREPHLKPPFTLGHHTVTCVTLFPKSFWRRNCDRKADNSGVWGNPAAVSSYRYLSPGPVQRMLRISYMEGNSNQRVMWNVYADSCFQHVCFYEFIFHFSLFFLPYCPFSIVWILKSVCERTSSHYSHVPLACPYIRTVLRWSWVWRIAVILLTGKLQYSEKTPATVPLCPPQIYADCPGNLEVHLNNWSLRKCSQTKCISHKTLIRPILRDGI
jgi:hypothetical protein